MLSLPHLIIIFLVALIVFGPEKIPELARGMGKIMGEFRRATGDLRSGFEEQMRQLEREAEVAESRKRAASRATAATNASNAAPPPLPEHPTAEVSSASAIPAESAQENSILPPSYFDSANSSESAPESNVIEVSTKAEITAPAALPASAEESTEKIIHGDAEPA